MYTVYVYVLVYIRFEIGFVPFFVPLGLLGLIIVWHFPKKCGNAAVPRPGKNNEVMNTYILSHHAIWLASPCLTISKYTSIVAFKCCLNYIISQILKHLKISRTGLSFSLSDFGLVKMLNLFLLTINFALISIRMVKGLWDLMNLNFSN